MKYVRMLVLTIVVVGVFLACDDDPMNLAFRHPGYLGKWLNNGPDPSFEDLPGINRWSYADGLEVFGVATPFACSNAHDSAYGDGKVWVTGWTTYGEEDIYKIWEAVSDESVEIQRPSPGLTYDGEMLWGADTDFEVSDVITKFYRMDPINYDITYVFNYSNSYEKTFKGLAWSDMGLWSVFSKPTPPPRTTGKFQ